MTEAEQEAEYSQRIGARIAEHRRAAGMTQTEFAARLGVSHSRISDIERGRGRVTVFTLARIAAVLGIEPAELVPEVTP